jgi:cytochrome b
MNEFLNNLKRQAEENPVLALGVGAALITAISKLIDSGATARNSNAWKQEVARRAMKDARK